ncbi:MAG: hypothetical protein D6820_13835 [Lentisphaerae bacterium]|nr:MAG: hypothetical protein D6820_13835 [Lentisphaerota bacterium]
MRLPTEAEWEYVCRAGTLNWGAAEMSIEQLQPYAVFNVPQPERIMSRKPNPWGFYDMLGNVAEWCLDAEISRPRSGPETYKDNIKDPINLKGTARIFRGGHCRERLNALTAYMRHVYYPTRASRYVGFRIVIAPHQPVPQEQPRRRGLLRR